MADVYLSSEEFRALASQTRAAIIKLLQERNHTLSEISKKLNLKAPSIKQHLDILSKADLIEPVESGRKWKYYSLTRKGKNIFLRKESTNILIVVAVSSISLLAMCHSMLSTYFSSSAPLNEGAVLTGTIDKALGGAEAVAEMAGAGIWMQSIMFQAIAIVSLAAMIVFLLVGLRKIKAKIK